MDLDQLLEKARAFEPSALAQIHDRFFPEIYRYVRYRLDPPEVCEDIASEVFLRLLDALQKNRGPTHNLRGWLYGTAANLVNDHLRSRYAHRHEPLEADSPLPSDHPAPERAYDDRWEQRQVRQAIQKLTADQQNVLALRFTEEHSLEETASLMGKSVTAIKALQFRAVAALRRILDEMLQTSKDTSA